MLDFRSLGTVSFLTQPHVQTVATLLNFVYAMTLYPEVQARAQQEIDTVVGRDRLATFEDRKQLPYLSSVVKEAFRWRPSVPLCTQRCVVIHLHVAH